MNSLFFHQTRSVIISFLVIIILLMVLLIIGQSAAFLTLTVDSGLSPFIFFEFIFRLIPIQVAALTPIALLAATYAACNAIYQAGEHSVLRAAGVPEHRYFTPTLTIGLLIAAIFALFVFELAPRSSATLREIERAGAEQVAQNTIINPLEPTTIGPAEIFVAATAGNQLQNLSIFAPALEDGGSAFLSASAAEFAKGPNGLALVLTRGRILNLDGDQSALSAQEFEQLLVDLGNQFTQENSAVTTLPIGDQTLAQLLNNKDKSVVEIRSHRIEAIKRIGYVIAVFAMPSWVLFWLLLSSIQRSGTAKAALVGPIGAIIAILALESTGRLSGGSELVPWLILAAILAMGFIGPSYFLFKNSFQDRVLSRRSKVRL